MKKNWFLLVFVVLLTIISLAIAIPTISFNFNNQEYTIRGIDPKDLNQAVVTEHFTFQNSMDFTEGYVVTLDLNLASVETDNVSIEDELNKITSVLYWRLLNARIPDFKINIIESEFENQFKISIKVPEFVNVEILQLLLSPANIQIAYLQEGETVSAIPLTIGNSDIESVSVISDSRCFLENYQNFCLNIVFKPEARPVLAEAIIAQRNLVLYIDQFPVGYQSPGQIFNPADLGKELIIAPDPGFGDTQLMVSMLASLISVEPLPDTVELSNFDVLGAALGDATLPLLNVALAMGVLSTMILVTVFFKKQTKLFVVTMAIFYIWSIALFKVMNLILSFSFLGGFIVATGFFFVALTLSQLKLIELAKGGLTANELKEVYNWISIRFRNLTILVLAIYFVLNYYGTLLSMNFVLGLGAGMVTGLITIVLAFKGLAPYILLTKK